MITSTKVSDDNVLLVNISYLHLLDTNTCIYPIPLNTGVKVSSDGSGDVSVDISGSSIIGNLDDGAQLESEGTGLLTVTITDTTVSDSKKKDIKVEQDTSTTLGTLEISGGFINGAGIETKNMNVNP